MESIITFSFLLFYYTHGAGPVSRVLLRIGMTISGLRSLDDLSRTDRLSKGSKGHTGQRLVTVNHLPDTAPSIRSIQSFIFNKSYEHKGIFTTFCVCLIRYAFLQRSLKPAP